MLGEIAAIGASLCWALAAVLFGRVGRHIDAESLTFIQCATVAVPMVVGFALLGNPRFWTAFGSSDLGLLTLSGLTGLTIGESAYFRSLDLTGPRLALLIWSMAPGATALIAWLWLGQRLPWLAVLGIALTLVGIIVVILGRRVPPETIFRADSADAGAGLQLPDETSSTQLAWGIGWGVVALFGQGVSYVALDGLADDAHAMEAHALRFLTAGLPLVVVVAATSRLDTLRRLPSSTGLVWPLAAATVIGTVVGTGLATFSIMTIDVSIAITLASLGPVFILPMTRMIDDQPVSLSSAAGALVAVGGAALVVLA